MSGERASDAGTFHSLRYQGHSVKLLWIASFILNHVFHKPIKGSKTKFRADFVVSTVVLAAVLTVRGAIPRVLTILFHNLPILMS